MKRRKSCLKDGNHIYLDCPSYKKFFKSRKLALTYANMQRNLYRSTMHVIDVYRCPMCKYWHMTSQPQRKRNPKPHVST